MAETWSESDAVTVGILSLAFRSFAAAAAALSAHCTPLGLPATLFGGIRILQLGAAKLGLSIPVADLTDLGLLTKICKFVYTIPFGF